MRHSFQSRSLFLEARLLRFAAGDVPQKVPAPDPIDKMDPASTIDEFRGLEKDGPDGPEKVAELDAKVKQVEGQCKEMLKQIKERGLSNPKWKDIHDTYYKQMQDIHLKSPDAQAKIDALTASMGRLETEANEAMTKPRELLDDKQRQEYDNISRETKTVVDAIRSGDQETADERLRVVNDLLGGADPAVRQAWIDQIAVNREGTVVIAKDGTRHSFRLDEGKQQFVIEHLVVKGGQQQVELDPVVPKDEPAANEQPQQVELEPVIPEKGNDVQQSTAEILANMQATLSDVLTQIGIAAEKVAEMLPKLMKVIEKHLDTIKAVNEAGFTPENAESILQQPDLPSVIAEVQKIGAENGWTAELTEAACVFFNDIFEAFTSETADEEGKTDEPVAPGEQPKDAVDPAKGAVDQLKDRFNKPVEMTEEERNSIKDAGEKILKEYNKIDKPTKAQSEQARGQLMMAGVDATAGVDALAKKPDAIKAKEGTEFQVTMNKVMGFVIYVMSILQEIKDTVKGKEGEEKKEGAERTKETARAEVDGHVDELKKFNDADEFSASGNGADTLKKLNDSTAAYVKDFGGEPDITQSVMDGAGSLYDVDTNAFVTVAYDVETKTYSFVPVEGDADAKPAEDAAEDNPEATREKDLAAAQEKTDAAMVEADQLIDADDDARRPALEAVVDAIDAELALMGEGELSSEEMVARKAKLDESLLRYQADLAALDEKPDEEEKPADEEEPEAEPEDEEAPEEGAEEPEESVDALLTRKAELQARLDELDDQKAENLTDGDLDQIKDLRKEMADVDAKLEAGLTDLRQQSTDLQEQLDALDDDKAEKLTDEDIDTVKDLRQQKKDVDDKIAEVEEALA